MVNAINFKSSRDSDFNAEYDYAPEDVADKIPAELGLENLPEDKKADFMKDFARLYTIKSHTDAAFEAEKVHFAKRKNRSGQEVLFLMIEHMKPSDLSLAVSNGQVVLPSVEKMTPEQYQDLAKFCWINNFSEVSFPANADEVFKQKFQQAYDSEENSAVLGYANSPEDKKEQSELEEEIRKERENSAQARNPSTEQQETPQEQKKEENAQENKVVTPDLNKIEKSMKTFMEIRSKKKKDSTYFKSHTWGGWLHYRIYASPDQRASDGIWDDKSKSFKSNYEIDLKFKNVKGRLEIRYAVPDGKPIPAKYADEIVGMMKANGYTTIDFGDLSDEDKGTFRKSCGQAGVLPTFNLGEKHARSMLAAAADNKLVGLSAYKKRMAQKLRGQVKKSAKPMEAEENKGLRSVILECEAENGIVSEGIVWNGTDVAQALKIAQNSLSEEDLYTFKSTLAKTLKAQMDAENSFSNQNPLKKTWERLDNEVAYKPFAEAFDRIQDKIQDISEGTKNTRAKAQDVIGAMDTAGELATYFAKYKNRTLREFIDDGKLNLAKEKEDFFKTFASAGWEDRKLRDFSADEFVQLYEIMKAENIRLAEKRLENDTRGKSGQDFNTAVNDLVKDATSKLKNAARTLRENGYRDASVIDVGSPVYERSDSAGKGRTQQQSNQNRTIDYARMKQRGGR